jgi:hypothetical protein
LRDFKAKGMVTTFVVVGTANSSGGGGKGGDDNDNKDDNDDNDNSDGYYDAAFDDLYKEFAHGKTPSYEYYQEMAQEEMPGYKVELAKSNRSQCVKCKNNKNNNKNKQPPPPSSWASVAATSATTETTAMEGDADPPKVTAARPRRHNPRPQRAVVVSATNAAAASATTTTTTAAMTVQKKTTDTVTDRTKISSGNIRIGSLNDISGSYGRWHHLDCWRGTCQPKSRLKKNESKVFVFFIFHCDDICLFCLLSQFPTAFGRD